ncbi:MAG: hypothetical protein KDD38_11510 [Bdellovibrionales bacterium]|nr:hypothetical protein [Bdellovibrionales bacterium]
MTFQSMASVFIIFSFLSAANAQLDAASQEALEKTNELLLDSNKRQEAIKGDKKAQQADSYAESIGGAHKEEIYGLTSKIFEKLIKKYNADPTKIQEVLTKAMANPEAFANSEFSPEDLKALRELANKLPQPVSGK